MKKIGLITYHSAYNFGSVLQAYATQRIIQKIAGNCEVINYRTREQRKYYSIIKWERGLRVIKSLIKNILYLPTYRQRLDREKQYEELISSLFNLSDECVEPDDVYRMWSQYDVIVSGSDQIWNKHSNELYWVSWDYMFPYLLKGYEGIKISYASSPSDMSDDEMKKLVPLIEKFDCVSFRERESVEQLRRIAGLDTTDVLDPTLLFCRDEWISALKLQKKDTENYILYYALSSLKERKKNLDSVLKYAAHRHMKVLYVAPFEFSARNNDVLETIITVTPIDFLNLILNASTIVTDSFHGTIFSANFNKDFYSINGSKASDFRKTDILKKLGLESRIIHGVEELLDKEYIEIDYSNVNTVLERERRKSINYLEKGLGVVNGDLH